MIGLDLLGVDEGGLVDASAAAAKGLIAAFKTKSNAPPVPPAPTAEQQEADESWLQKRIAGPVKVWHTIIGLVVVVGGAVLWPRKKS